MVSKALSATPLPTDLFAANNFIALGALRALQEKGLHVSDDIALVTFDDTPSTFPLDPFLTILSQPAREMR